MKLFSVFWWSLSPLPSQAYASPTNINAPSCLDWENFKASAGLASIG